LGNRYADNATVAAQQKNGSPAKRNPDAAPPRRLADRTCRGSAVAGAVYGVSWRCRHGAPAKRTHFTVFGNPSDELRGLLDQFGATYLTPFDDLK